MKKVKSWNYLAAILAANQNNFDPINHTGVDFEEEGVFELSVQPKATNIDPERYILQKELLQQLGTEAKELLQIIFESPESIAESFFFTSKQERHSPKLLKRYLQRHLHWPQKKIIKSFKEIQSLLQALET